MKKSFLLFSALFAFCLFTQAQTVVSSFDDITLDSNSYRDGFLSLDRTNKGFQSGKAFFKNFYDTSFGGFWAGGFAISNKKDIALDSLTTNYTKLYNSITTTGAEATTNYANGQNHAVVIFNDSVAKYPQSIYVTNSNYAYLSMKWGDGLAHKFGDTDYFKLTISGYYQGVAKNIVVVLASGKNILTDWMKIDLRNLGKCDSIAFNQSSSDNDPTYGMNTPGFFCIDQLTLSSSNNGIHENGLLASIGIYPNPCQNNVFIQLQQNVDLRNYRLIDVAGNSLLSGNENNINVSSLSNGVYFLCIETNKGNITRKFIKQAE